MAGLIGSASSFDVSWSDKIEGRTSGRKVLSGLENSSHRPIVKAVDCKNGAYAVDRLKAGPVNIPEEENKQKKAKTKYTDLTWSGHDVFYHKGAPTDAAAAALIDNIDNNWNYKRWTDVTTSKDYPLFKDDTVSYVEPN